MPDQEIKFTTSAIVRSYNSASTIRASLLSLAEQTTRPQIVVVDSGSTDGTLEIAAAFADVIIHLAPREFTFGLALNRGVGVCTGQVIFALSSHVVAPGNDWVDRSLRYYEDPHVIATCGASFDADGEPLDRVLQLDRVAVRASTRWGLSNTAASWRADAVMRFPFDEDLEACEDKEWTYRALQGEEVLIVDPLLDVDSSHRKRKGPAAYLQRVCREHVALFQFGAQRPQGLGRTIRDWWRASAHPVPGQRGFTSWTRATETLARVVAERRFADSSGLHASARWVTPVLSTIWDAGDDAWNAAVDVADRRGRGWLAFVLATAVRARSYRALVVVGSLGRVDLYQDLAVAVLVRRLTHPRVRLVITDCTWEPGSDSLASGSAARRRVSTFLHHVLVKLVDGPNTIFCVLSEFERSVFPACWDVDPGRVAVTEFSHTIIGDMEPRVSSGHYIFAGGDSQRDYDLLVGAAEGMSEDFVIATREELTHVPSNVTVKSLPHSDYLHAMGGARVVVVPLRSSEHRSAGQQTYLNAMLLRKPTVVTDVPWVREAITDGVDGVVAAAEAAALREALHRTFHAHPATLSEMGERARATVLAGFTPQLYRRRLLAVAKGEQ